MASSAAELTLNASAAFRGAIHHDRASLPAVNRFRCP